MIPYSSSNGTPSAGLFWKRFSAGLGLGGALLAGSLAGCSPLRLLAPGQRLLHRVKVEGTERADAERLQSLVQQQPNSTFPLPKVAIYQLGRTFYNPDRIQRNLAEEYAHYTQRIQEAGTDSAEVGKLLTKRERHVRRHQLALDKGNAIMRLGEPPVVYDSTLTARTVEQLSTFLRSKGFFRNSVTAVDTVPTRTFAPLRLLTLRSPFRAEPRRVTVVYRVREGVPFRLSQLDYDIADSAVARYVRAGQPQSLLHVGDQYDEEVIGQERSRLDNLLKNQGFYDFREQYISLEADTSFAPATVRLRTLVAPPATGGPHRQYAIRHVTMVTDAGLVRFGRQRDTLVRDSVHYLAYEHRFSTKALDRKLSVRPGHLYSQRNTQLTQRQLANLDMFRFSAVTYRRVRGPEAPADSAQGLLDATINASPAKKYQETTEFGGTYVAERVGPFGNVRWKVRNVFGGAEILELGLRAGFEGQFSATGGDGTRLESVLTTQLGANVNLVLPQFLVPWRTNRYLASYNPQTRINAAYTYVQRPEYTRTNAEATYDYIWQRNAFQQYVLTPLDISIIGTPQISAEFRRDLELLQLTQGSPLIRAFDNLFIPSVSATSVYNSNDFNQTRDARYLRLYAEAGGLTRSLYQRQPLEAASNRLKVYDFGKLTADYRRYHKLGPSTYVVYRLSGGLATALSGTRTTIRGDNGVILRQETDYLIPYDKYLFAGGSSSVRAWKPRRLGPGSFTQYRYDTTGVLTSERDYNLEQPGEVLLEGNVEYRFPLYSFVKGALFTDFGNVWALRSNPQRPGATFRLNKFYRQLAVGSGIGFRFDFEFLILRLDVATKVYDPTAPGSKWAIRRFSLREDQTAFNLGIGYPF